MTLEEFDKPLPALSAGEELRLDAEDALLNERVERLHAVHVAALTLLNHSASGPAEVEFAEAVLALGHNLPAVA